MGGFLDPDQGERRALAHSFKPTCSIAREVEKCV
jgi:hypothetical protein